MFARRHVERNKEYGRSIDVYCRVLFPAAFLSSMLVLANVRMRDGYEMDNSQMYVGVHGLHVRMQALQPYTEAPYWSPILKHHTEAPYWSPILKHHAEAPYWSPILLLPVEMRAACFLHSVTSLPFEPRARTDHRLAPRYHHRPLAPPPRRRRVRDARSSPSMALRAVRAQAARPRRAHRPIEARRLAPRRQRYAADTAEGAPLRAFAADDAAIAQRRVAIAPQGPCSDARFANASTAARFAGTTRDADGSALALRGASVADARHEARGVASSGPPADGVADLWARTRGRVGVWEEWKAFSEAWLLSFYLPPHFLLGTNLPFARTEAALLANAESGGHNV